MLCVRGLCARGSSGGIVRQADASVGQELGEGRPVIISNRSLMALATGLCLDIVARSERSQASRSMMSGADSRARASGRALGSKPLMSSSMSKNASIRLTASNVTGEI